jgi:hypothetical protein
MFILTLLTVNLRSLWTVSQLRVQGFVCGRIKSHVPQLFLQAGVPVVFNLIIGSPWELCSNSRPSAIAQAQSKQTSHRNLKLLFLTNKMGVGKDKSSMIQQLPVKEGSTS